LDIGIAGWQRRNIGLILIVVLGEMEVDTKGIVGSTNCRVLAGKNEVIVV
jgi:hypothetical protein